MLALIFLLLIIAASYRLYQLLKKPGGEPRKKVDIPVRKLGRGVLGLGIVVVLVSTIGGSFYRVGEQEQAVVTQFGKVLTTKTAGLYFRIPFVQQVRKVDTTVSGVPIGYSVGASEQEYTSTLDSMMITSDFNLVNIDFYLEYRVSDPVKYLYTAQDPKSVLRNEAMNAIRSIVSNYTVDEVITTGKSQIQSDVKETLMKYVEEDDIGISIVNMSIQDAEPPTAEVMAAFKAVETAKQGAQTASTQANQYKNERIPAAEANADKIRQAAAAQKEARIAEAQGQVERFNKMYEEYEKYPLITKKRMLYEALEEVLPGAKVIITDGGTETLLPLDSFSSITAADNEGSPSAE